MEKKYIEVNEGELIRWRGLWSVDKESYALGDVVAHAKTGYGTCTYKASVGHVPSAATEPEDGASWETVWEEFLVGGQNGSGEGTGDVLSTGVAGGQTIIGGTGSAENLVLKSSSHGTKGDVSLEDIVSFNVGQTGANRFVFTLGTYPAFKVLDSSDNVVSQLIYSPAVGAISYDFLASTGWFSVRNSINGSDALKVDANGDTWLVGDCSPASITNRGPHLRSILSKTANYTITDTDPDIVVVGAITALTHATFVLPTAADNTGRIITIIIDGDPGAYNVVVDGEGSETINGATTKTNSVQYSFLMLLCNGVGWDIIGSAGTWT